MLSSYSGNGRDGKPTSLKRFFDVDAPTVGATQFPQVFEQSNSMMGDAEFYEFLEASIPAEIVQRTDRVLDDARRLQSRGLAAEYHQDDVTWRRAVIQAWCHSRDMTVIMSTLGYDKDCTGIHDIEEYAPARAIKLTANSRTSDWYQRWCSSLRDEEMVNIGYWNPNLCASLCNWGTDKTGAQDAMHAHRLSEHHEGHPDCPPDIVEHAVNFVIHHLPREHMGVRHLPLGDWDDLESAIDHTPLMQVSTIEQEIARDAACALRRLEVEGKVTPWHLLKV
ncbi:MULTISPECIES: hypothetical protein [Agrobacterium tumefaciens complex]|uniref:hypothetical protein n=1 Tax=Agrobacterium tumefaciens TaxID=358 RepID=UPI000FE3A93D|nr:hypothetical protein [Agrobacterium tumefaciens]